MKVLTVYEFETNLLSSENILDLRSTQVKSCTGCWSCWMKTPGRCVYSDLNVFYHQYVTADKAIFFLQTKMGFVSSNIKNLFDRMIPLFLPYCNFHTGESMHDARYLKYPDIEVFYKDDFENKEEQRVFEEYTYRTFYQFHSKKSIVKPFTEYQEATI